MHLVQLLSQLENYNNVEMTKSLENKKVKLEMISPNKDTDQFLCDKNNENLVEIEYSKVFKCATNNPSIDSRLFRKPENETEKPWIFLTQCKKTSNETELLLQQMILNLK